MLRLIFKRTKPNKLGRWNYTNAERKIDLANVDHCGTCILNPIQDHFEKKSVKVKLEVKDINKQNEEWRKNKYLRCGDDVIIM